MQYSGRCVRLSAYKTDIQGVWGLNVEWRIRCEKTQQHGKDERRVMRFIKLISPVAKVVRFFAVCQQHEDLWTAMICPAWIWGHEQVILFQSIFLHSRCRTLEDRTQRGHSKFFSCGIDSVQVAKFVSSRHWRCHPCILATIRCCKGCNISVYCSLICTCIHQQASHHYSLSRLVSNWNTIWRHHQFSKLGTQAIWYITLYVCMYVCVVINGKKKYQLSTADIPVVPLATVFACSQFCGSATVADGRI